MKTLRDQIKKNLKVLRSVTPVANTTAVTSPISNPADMDENLFKEAVKDAHPLPNALKHAHLHHPPKKPKPIPRQFIFDEQQAPADTLSDQYIPAHALETGEELLYLRAGHSPDILSKLRRGHWVVQATIDLHGLISDEARPYVAMFLSDCKKRRLRCVRIVHGKGLGSRNREPVLKQKLRSWLMQRDEVIAYVQSPKNEGGSGAVIVLLKEVSLLPG